MSRTYQRSAALPIQCKHAHQLPVARLAPGIQFQLAPSVVLGQRVLRAPLVVDRELGERHQRTLVHPLAFEQRPLLEGRAVGQKKARQKLAVIPIDCLLESPRAGCAGFRMAMRVPITCIKQIGEGRHVDLVVAGVVELDGRAADPQERRRGALVPDRMAQIGQRLPQIGARILVGLIGPEQSGQRVAGMRIIGFKR
jgi:hypothetical protein